MKTLRKNSRSGQGLVEYALILVLAAVVVIVIMATLARPTKQAATEDAPSEQLLRAALAAAAHVDPQEIVIKRFAISTTTKGENSYFLEVQGKDAMGWCTLVESTSQPFCQVFTQSMK